MLRKGSKRSERSERSEYMHIGKYINIWWILTNRATQTAFASRFGAVFFLLGKLLRFIFFLFFLVLLQSKTKAIAGYSFWQIILFYVTFNLVDVVSQLFLREVYRFRYYVTSGNFDFILLKPYSPLFRSLFGGSDILDLPILLLSVGCIVFAITKVGLGVTEVGIFFYILLLLNAFLIALSFHIFVLAIGVLTTEVDNTIMLYRDITQMGRVPVDIYQEPLKGLLTFVVPVGVMVTFPAKMLFGYLSLEYLLLSFVIGILFFAGSRRFWQFSLRHYSSASS